MKKSTPSKKLSNFEIGQIGEETAVDYLAQRNIRILRRNLRTEYGEIDILCQDGECLVFAEVKTRRSKQFGFPEAAVTGNKQNHMVNSAIAYLQETDNMDKLWRIDVIAVNFDASLAPKIKWFKNAITC